jgi:anaerobic ribonucleoside-triphosphate reductase
MRSKERIMGKCTVEVFSRVCGFFRPVQAWNPGKREEHSQKKTYKVKEDKKENK